MKTTILLLLTIPTLYAKNPDKNHTKETIATLQQENHNLHQQIHNLSAQIKTYKKIINTKETILKKALTKITSDIWSLLITHAKKWYTPLATTIIIWYKSTLPFPFRETITSYF